MKILIVSDAWRPQVNGVVRTYEHIMDAVHKTSEHSIDVIGPADFPLRFPLPGYSEIHLAIAPYRRLRRLIETIKPDSLHIATEGPLGKAARKYCLKNGLSFTTAYHTQFPDYAAKRIAKILPFMHDATKRHLQKLIRNFHAPSQAIMITTKSIGEELRALGYTSPLHELSRGVHLDMFYPGEPDDFHDLPRPIALYVGRVAIEKNLEDFLDMDWHGSKVVVGDGPSLSFLKEKYPESRFTGKKTGKELASCYRSADIFVFPSRTDTFGIVIIEALASGLPVAGYNVTGPKDIITEAYLGALHHDDLAHAAQAALGKAADAHKRHAHIKDRYSWDNAARQFIEIQTAVPLKP